MNSGDRDSQRRKVLLLIAVVSGLVCLLAAAGPVFGGDVIPQLFSLACHQNPERCLVVAGHPMALCARCFGLFLGFGLGAGFAFLRPFARRSALCILLTAVVLTAFDVGAERLGLYTNLIPLRLVTGTILGTAISLMIGARQDTPSLSIETQPNLQNP